MSSQRFRPQQSEITIRLAHAGDADALATLAQLDSARPLAGEAIVAEAAGRLVAALSLFDGRAVADPFVPSADAVAMLRLRAAQARVAGGRRRRARRARPARTLPAHAA